MRAPLARLRGPAAGWPAAVAVAAAALAACAPAPPQPAAPAGASSSGPAVRPGVPGAPAPDAAPAAVAPKPAAPPAPATRAARPGRPGPIPEAVITLQGRCAQSEPDGFREQAVLEVAQNEVRALAWDVWIGQRGSCRFDHADFRQTKQRPHIELLARDGSGCKLMVWQEPRRVTLAHAGCEKRCTQGVYDRAWPVMFDPATGGCARL
jgi:hypothetical protein